jgi:LysR family transcriptional regulator, hydrogen peroxide-inducible genes activator
MTLIQLTYLVALADHGHFGRAAEACFVSQPTLSTQIQKLEDELEALLFDRSKHPVKPTERGVTIIAQARSVLAERDALYGLVRKDGPVTGELRLGVIPTVSPYLMPRLAPMMTERYPQVRLSVEEVTTARLMERLRRGHVDAAVVATDESASDLHLQELFDEPFLLYLNRAHPLARRKRVKLADVEAADDLWLLAEGHCLRDQVVEWCGKSAGRSGESIRFESGSLETLRHLVDHLGGMTLLPAGSTSYLDDAARAAIRSFSGTTPGRSVRLVRMKGSLRDQLIDAFAEVAREAAKKLAEAVDA